MKNAFVASPTDVGLLTSSILRDLTPEPIVCSSFAELAALRQASTVYFVVSQLSMCSSAYQELVRAAFALTQDLRRLVLRLDQVNIPDGFQMLQSLREGTPQ